MKLTFRLAAFAASAALLASPVFAAATIKVARSAELSASAAKTWETVHAFDGLHTWHPAVEKTEMKSGSDNKPGSVRVLSLKGGGTIVETLTKYSASRRTMTYRIDEPGPLPVVGYVSTISVKPAMAGASVIRWTSSFKAKEGVSDADAKKAIEGVYDAGLDNLKK